jgi:hypothetical protein
MAKYEPVLVDNSDSTYENLLDVVWYRLIIVVLLFVKLSGYTWVVVLFTRQKVLDDSEKIKTASFGASTNFSVLAENCSGIFIVVGPARVRCTI